MKVLPVITITPKNLEVNKTCWHGFEITKQNGSLALSKQGHTLALFDLIRLYEEYAVFVGKRGDDYFVVNKGGEISQDLTIVADEIFINGYQLYVEVKIRRMGSCYFNVLEISNMDILFRGEDLQPGKKSRKLTNWPIWNHLVDVDNNLIIIEKNRDYFGFYSLNHKKYGLLVDLVEDYQCLSQGEYIVYSLVSFGYYKIKSLREVSVENCEGFLSETDSLSEEGDLTTMEKDFNDLNCPASSDTPADTCDMIAESSSEYCRKFENSSSKCLEKSIKSCTEYLLTCAPKEKVVLALVTLFREHASALGDFSDGVKLYLKTLEDSIALSDMVDDDFMNKIHENLNSDELKDDFNLCRAYFSRNIKVPYEQLKNICEDNLIGEIVKQNVEAVRKQWLRDLTLNHAQVLDCFTLYVNEILDEWSISKTENLIVHEEEVNPLLEKYIQFFSSLTSATRNGMKAPHKSILLLTVASFIENGNLSENKIVLTQNFENEFVRLWNLYVGSTPLFNANIAMPFWHMQHEPFWHLYRYNGQNLETLKNSYSVYSLRVYTYAKIDDDLFSLLQNEVYRSSLKQTLLKVLQPWKK